MTKRPIRTPDTMIAKHLLSSMIEKKYIYTDIH